MRKVKKIIVGFLRLLPLLPIVIMILNSINLVDFTVQNYIPNLEVSLIDWFMDYFPSIPFADTFFYWLVNDSGIVSANDDYILQYIILFGSYQLLISLLVLFYDFITFIINWASEWLGGIYAKAK